ncbi:MAG TPA: PA0069 family radical SAM protein [Polyangiaceae bacterium]|jgi:DNA repair photolyase|nr:PA0069 family radical SAM protein [Polyangiaceae bacterium]
MVRALPRRNPRSPWESQWVEYLGEPPAMPLEVYEDDTRNILSKNDSPDLGFTYSVNPYRGCYHGCWYCYARPTHEYLGFGSGTDFERKIVVKRRAPELLRAALGRRSWRRETIFFSGNTDCYQPLEASYRLTRGCLEVLAEAKNPVHVITKAPLVERDLDVLQSIASVASLGVTLSVPFWDADAARLVEPGVATPARRMLTVERLAKAGIDVSVNVAPVIPGLTDRDIPNILEAAANAGARSASMVMLRLPGNVRHVFESRLRDGFPLTAEKVLARTREVRGGELNDPRFGSRMRGEGHYAEAIQRLFETTRQRLGLGRHERMEGGASRGAETSVSSQAGSSRDEETSVSSPKRGQLRLFGE